MGATARFLHCGRRIDPSPSTSSGTFLYHNASRLPSAHAIGMNILVGARASRRCWAFSLTFARERNRTHLSDAGAERRIRRLMREEPGTSIPSRGGLTRPHAPSPTACSSSPTHNSLPPRCLCAGGPFHRARHCCCSALYNACNAAVLWRDCLNKPGFRRLEQLRRLFCRRTLPAGRIHMRHLSFSSVLAPLLPRTNGVPYRLPPRLPLASL